MSRGPDIETLLRRAFERAAEAQGCAVSVTPTGLTRWASATFTGARHRLTLEGGRCARLDRWIAALPELDLPLRHHLVADVSVLSVVRQDAVTTVTLEALTVES